MSIRVLACSGSLDGGGSERQLSQFVAALHRNPFDVQVYLQYRRGIYLQSLPTDVPVHDFWSNYHRRFGYPGRIWRSQIRHLAGVLASHRIELVYDRTYHMTLVTGPACRLAGCPRISVITSPPSRDLGARREPFRYLKRRLLARYYSAPGAVTVAVSEQVAQDAAEFYALNRNRMVVLPNAVDPQAISEQSVQAVMGESAPERLGAFWLVVGRMTPEKGHADALHAFARATGLHSPYQPVSLVLIGDGPQRAHLERLVRALGIVHRVHFLGVQANPFPWMRAARGVIVPSHYEGLPNVVLEALALGTPVLATRCSPDLEELLAEGRGYLVDVGSVDQLASALERWHVDAEDPEERRRAAQQYVLQKFGIDAWAEAMRQLVVQTTDPGFWSGKESR